METKKSRYSKCQNMILGIAIGDAFGVGYEFLAGGRDAVRERFDFTQYTQNPSPSFATPLGMYTDDTQMSIGVIETLLSDKEFSLANLADHFVECFKRDPIRGYAGGFLKFLQTVESGEEFLENIKPQSIRNGAAMRAVPLGVLPDRDSVVYYATVNAKATHDTPKGIASSVCVALASHFMFYQIGGLEDIHDFIGPYILAIDPVSAQHYRDIQFMRGENPDILYGEDVMKNGCYVGKKADKGLGIPCDGMRTVGAALYLLGNYGDSTEEVLKRAVCLGGDTDSVAAIATGLAAIRNGIDDLPEFLLCGLTNHKYGKDYLQDIGGRLDKMVGKWF